MILGLLLVLAKRSHISLMNFYYKKRFPEIDKSVTIGLDTLIFGERNDIVIKEGTFIQRNCSITGNVEIGRHCAIASNVNIRADTHDIRDIKKRESRIIKEGKIKIGDYVWIGANAFIKENVRIGNNAIIGANTVITKDVPANSVYAGVAGRRIK